MSSTACWSLDARTSSASPDHKPGVELLRPPYRPMQQGRSENDIRCQVTRRKISAGTRSDVGRDCRDAFLGLAKTCAKHGVAFWEYLGSRLSAQGSPHFLSV